MRKKEILQKAKKETNSLHTIKRRKVNLIGHVWHKNCLLIHVIEGKIEERREGTGRRERRRKQPEGKGRILGTERGSARLHSLENSLWQRL